MDFIESDFAVSFEAETVHRLFDFPILGQEPRPDYVLAGAILMVYQSAGNALGKRLSGNGSITSILQT
jgi:hypothetical protein